MAVLKAPNSSALLTFRAAAWAVQMNIGTLATPTWAWLRGISKFDPKFDGTLADDSDIDSDGWGSELMTMQKLNIDVEGLIKGTESTLSVIPDPGVAFLRDKGSRLGYENICQLRYWRTDDIDEGYIAQFAAKYTDVGGGNADLQKFTATLSGRGKPTKINRPQATAVNEVQLVTVVSATGGTFTLSLLGKATAGLAPTAPVATVQTALSGLSTIGTGNVLVTRNPGAYTVAFTGTLAGLDVPQLVANGSALTGVGAAVGVTTVTQGAAAA